MYVHEGYHVGDAWYFVDSKTDTVHMFYLAWTLEGGRPFAGHAVSGDLVNWRRLPPALQTGPSGSWDDLRICTGSVIERGGRYWMAYSATSLTDSSLEDMWAQHRVQRVGMAVSDDLVTWRKLPENPTLESVGPYYEQMASGQRNMVHWRDPFLYDDGDAAYQLICARRMDGDVATRGIVALARSTDMRSWEIMPPLEHDRIAEEMEVPQIYRINGRWYLVFCTLGRFLSPDFASRFNGRVPGRSNFSMVADSPFGPFRIHGMGQIVDHPPDAYFYAAQLVNFRGEWNLLATVDDDKGSRVSDPVPVCGDETGIHGRVPSPT